MSKISMQNFGQILKLQMSGALADFRAFYGERKSLFSLGSINDLRGLWISFIAGSVVAVIVGALATWLLRGKYSAVDNRRVARVAENKQSLQLLYFEAGLQYYVSARFAAIAGFLPIAGNLFHHALEMCLKGYLCKNLCEEERRNLGHTLGQIWHRFKNDISDSALDKFDSAIAALDRFEAVRYPEETAKRGIIASINFKKVDAVLKRGAPKRPEPVYDIVVGELDTLTKLIFEKSNINPLFFTNGLNNDARVYLKRWNEAASWEH